MIKYQYDVYSKQQRYDGIAQNRRFVVGECYKCCAEQKTNVERSEPHDVLANDAWLALWLTKAPQSVYAVPKIEMRF